MSRIAQTLGVSRSNLIATSQTKPVSRGMYQRQGDTEAYGWIKHVVDARPTYGYRRVTALVNRLRQSEGLENLNHKRVYRIMFKAGWLLQRHTAKRPERRHDGKVIAMRSNIRWCSDGLEFKCWNGEVVRAAFIMDTHDREIISFTAVAKAGISGSDIRDILLEAVEKRFEGLQVPNPIELLTDNGSPYRAAATKQFVNQLGITSCFTPVASPESNGVAEAFVKTFKRDYVSVKPVPDAETALRLIKSWIEDYNEYHPHSGLKMRSPRQYIRALSSTA
jgi:putative transposase